MLIEQMRQEGASLLRESTTRGIAALALVVAVIAACNSSKQTRQPEPKSLVQVSLPTAQSLSHVVELLPPATEVATVTFIEGGETLTLRCVPPSHDADRIAGNYFDALREHSEEMRRLLGSPEDEPDPGRAAFVEEELSRLAELARKARSADVILVTQVGILATPAEVASYSNALHQRSDASQ